MFMNDAGRVIINDWTIGFTLGLGMRSNAWSRVLLSGARSILMPLLVANDIGRKLLPDVSTPEKDRIRTSAHDHIADSVIALQPSALPNAPAANGSLNYVHPGLVTEPPAARGIGAPVTDHRLDAPVLRVVKFKRIEAFTSWTSPPVTSKVSGSPLAFVRRWILVEKPPHERLSAS
ncbi:MAG: hypothetical protein USCAAHI_01189 [Beijerinckiaceae bacterium]|nr:MAG: hypothetical protein USCAAHI_01189 [Beijerinckiaceae bacterium]